MIYKKPNLDSIMENCDSCCSICFESLDEKQAFQKWNCSHRFHENCVQRWNNGCPMCRTRRLIESQIEEIEVTWSISRNPSNVLDLDRMKSMNIYLEDDLIPMYKNVWKDRDCIDQNHSLWFFKPFAVLCICENCNTVQSFNRIH